MKRTGTGFDKPGIPTVGKKLLLDLQGYLAGFPYDFLVMTKKGPNLDELSHLDTHSVDVYLSRLPNLLKIIRDHYKKIPNDLWGLLYGYPLREAHQFTYASEAWAKG